METTNFKLNDTNRIIDTIGIHNWRVANKHKYNMLMYC